MSTINPDAYNARYIPPAVDFDHQLRRWRASEERLVASLHTSTMATERRMLKDAIRDIRAEIARVEAARQAHSERTSS